MEQAKPAKCLAGAPFAPGMIQDDRPAATQHRARPTTIGALNLNPIKGNRRSFDSVPASRDFAQDDNFIVM
jgi:hypothetical protein